MPEANSNARHVQSEQLVHHLYAKNLMLPRGTADWLINVMYTKWPQSNNWPFTINSYSASRDN